MGVYQSQLQDVMKETNFTEVQVKRLYKRFVKLDTNASGTLEKSEILSIPQIANNPLAHRLLAVFDADNSGYIDFKEFLVGVSAISARGNKIDTLKCILLLKKSCVQSLWYWSRWVYI